MGHTRWQVARPGVRRQWTLYHLGTGGSADTPRGHRGGGGDTGAMAGTMEPLTQDEQDLPFSSPSPSPVISQHSELCGKLSQFSLALASDYDGVKVRGRAEIIRWRRPDSKLKPLTV